MNPQEQAVLEQLGLRGWSIVGRKGATRTETTRDANNDPVKTEVPLPNTFVWTITDGQGRARTLTVRATTPTQYQHPTGQRSPSPPVTSYEVIDPPKDATPASEAKPPVVASEPTRQFNPDGTPNLNYVPPTVTQTNPDKDVITAIERQTAEALRGEREANQAAGRGYLTNAEVQSQSLQAGALGVQQTNAATSAGNLAVSQAAQKLAEKKAELAEIVQADASKLQWAEFEYKKYWDELQYQLGQQSQALAARKVDVDESQGLRSDETSRRGQDLGESQSIRSTGATTRGQDLTYQQGAARMAADMGIEASRSMSAALPFVAPSGTGEDLTAYRNAITSGSSAPMAALPTRSMPFPYDPRVLARQVADEAIAAMSPSAAQALGRPVELPRFTAPVGARR